MPAVPSYPGVYVEEIPSGQFTITGVPTSITAFVGRALCGPIDEAVTLFTFGDYERIFGGLAYDFPLSYAVHDFFMNGGGQAFVARLFEKNTDLSPSDWTKSAANALTAMQTALKPAPAPAVFNRDDLLAAGAKAAAALPQPDQTFAQTMLQNVTALAPTTAPTTAQDFATAVAALTAPPYPTATATMALDSNGGAALAVPAEQVLNLVAANPGAWGNNMMATTDVDNITAQSAKIFAKYQLEQEDLFNLTVFYKRPNGTTDVERFTNLTVKQLPDASTPPPNRIDLVLAAESHYVRVATDEHDEPTLPATAPVLATGAATGGSDGRYLQTSTYVGDERQNTGIYMLNQVDLFNLLCIPPDNRVIGCDTVPEVYQQAMAYCFDRRAILIVDPPGDWSDKYKKGELDHVTADSLHMYGTQTRNAAVYFPRVIKEDVMMDGQLDVFPACGAIAGVIATTDVQRGVWKAPAGQSAGLNNVHGLELSLTDDEQGKLNLLGINCLRNLPLLGPVVWGARTLRGADQLSDDFKYLSVRRLSLFLEESLYRGTRWAVFEANNEALWSSLRLAIEAFMDDLGKKGAFYGFKIKCDNDTNPQSNIDKGIVTVLIEYAPVKPAEFIVLQFQQQAGLSPT